MPVADCKHVAEYAPQANLASSELVVTHLRACWRLGNCNSCLRNLVVDHVIVNMLHAFKLLCAAARAELAEHAHVLGICWLTEKALTSIQHDACVMCRPIT